MKTVKTDSMKPTPISPPTGPAAGSFNGHHHKSNFFAVIKRNLLALSLVSLMLAFAECEQVYADVFNLKTDFSATNNPNGAWMYGWWDANHSAFTNGVSNSDTAWTRWSRLAEYPYAPDVQRNDGSAESAGVQPGQVSLHPGPGGELGNVRWTAPKDIIGNAHIVGQFLPGDSGIMSVYVLKNGDWNNILWQGTDSGTFDLSVPLAAGDTIDFAVGAISSYSFGNTPIEASITCESEPKPSLDIHLYAGLAISGVIGTTYEIQYSTDLSSNTWQPLVDITLPTNPYLYVDTTSPASGQRFYRAAVKK